ncbi:hypothetical protein LFT44_01060 [Arthrobacter sp. FW306-05-C]|uniref:hypothetical protein n=1 Tax=Arthrobacter sp. FW306-05-C TaxID=2879620 RepID=UPI001F4416C5|nr:hypothetical protein [Arthrobacter sp. FW306-05-C]UKA67065.1 hypothetical protein LFT44_01060 [Arthrobacter sp. FW306-05-C]
MTAEQLAPVPPDPEPWLPSDTPAEIRQFAIESLRWQAQEIIDELLSSTDPSEELSRARLRRSVARNPGRPEKALLEQLTASEDGLGLQAHGPHPQTSAPPQGLPTLHTSTDWIGS